MSRSSFLPWLLVASCWALPQSAAFNGSGYLQFTPSGSAWQSLSSWRVELSTAARLWRQYAATGSFWK